MLALVYLTLGGPHGGIAHAWQNEGADAAPKAAAPAPSAAPNAPPEVIEKEPFLSILVEASGLFGAVLLIGGYLVVFWRGFRLYWLAPDFFGRYLALGCVSLIVAQALFNMSMVISLLPTKGIPLPLVSYGGSALLCTLATFGLLMSVSERSAE